MCSLPTRSTVTRWTATLASCQRCRVHQQSALAGGPKGQLRCGSRACPAGAASAKPSERPISARRRARGQAIFRLSRASSGPISAACKCATQAQSSRLNRDTVYNVQYELHERVCSPSQLIKYQTQFYIAHMSRGSSDAKRQVLSLRIGLWVHLSRQPLHLRALDPPIGMLTCLPPVSH